jgi:hypothetical protein
MRMDTLIGKSWVNEVKKALSLGAILTNYNH